MILGVGNTNLLGPLNWLRQRQEDLDGTLERLASGKKINSGKDDPAGLVSAEQLKAAIAALEAESAAIERQNAFLNIADAQLSSVGSMMSELNAAVVAAGNQGALSEEELAAYQLEVDSLVGNITHALNEASGTLEGYAISTEDGDVQSLLSDASAALASLASGGSANLTSGDLSAAESAIAAAFTAANAARGAVGSYQQNWLEPRLAAVSVERENLLAALSLRQDADYAEETSNLSQHQVLSAAAMSVLKIAQEQSKSVLNLLA